MGKKCSPQAFVGIPAGKFFCHGDGDGELFPDGEFPVAIPSTQPRSNTSLFSSSGLTPNPKPCRRRPHPSVPASYSAASSLRLPKRRRRHLRPPPPAPPPPRSRRNRTRGCSTVVCRRLEAPGKGACRGF
jgi:hypothetical protein